MIRMYRKLKKDWKNVASMRKYLYGIIALTVIISGGVWLESLSSNDAPSPLDPFAQCLAEKEVAMYGADWCPHCQKEKKEFGSAFKYVPYVECPQNPKKCLDMGVDGYPTWIFKDGRKLVGEQGLEKLARESGCVLPNEEL